ncbi:MAG: hypothetical protein KAS66_15920 [Candidatus Omnitrophica bacterium]|nr:hypothetical protein [Candidatus Omnitrophota bacterium]
MREIYKVNGFLEVDYKCRGFCKIPYYNHPKGCPSFGKYEHCPPQAPLVKDAFDFSQEMYFVIEEFNLKRHVERMHIRHPHWSLRQCRNLLYWQGGVRKRLRTKTEEFIERRNNGMTYTLLPEAMGVMVINTAIALGIPIERTPENKVIKISLVGHPHSTMPWDLSKRSGD